LGQLLNLIGLHRLDCW